MYVIISFLFFGLSGSATEPSDGCQLDPSSVNVLERWSLDKDTSIWDGYRTVRASTLKTQNIPLVELGAYNAFLDRVDHDPHCDLDVRFTPVKAAQVLDRLGIFDPSGDVTQRGLYTFELSKYREGTESLAVPLRTRVLWVAGGISKTTGQRENLLLITKTSHPNQYVVTDRYFRVLRLGTEPAPPSARIP